MDHKLTQLKGLAEEWKSLGRQTGMSPYSTHAHGYRFAGIGVQVGPE